MEFLKPEEQVFMFYCSSQECHHKDPTTYQGVSFKGYPMWIRSQENPQTTCPKCGDDSHAVLITEKVEINFESTKNILTIDLPVGVEIHLNVSNNFDDNYFDPSEMPKPPSPKIVKH